MIWLKTTGYADYIEHWESRPFTLSTDLPPAIAHVATLQLDDSGKYHLCTWLQADADLDIECGGIVEYELSGPQFSDDAAWLLRTARHGWLYWAIETVCADHDVLVGMYRYAVAEALNDPTT